MKFNCSVRVKTQIKDIETGEVVSEQPWKKNLVLDNGLNAMAKQSSISGMPPCTCADAFKNIIVGSGTNPNSVASGAITFTQSGTTITASSSFFTASMVGAIFKWGTGSGGNEVRIVSQSGTTAIVDISATVVVPDVATVWLVNQTALQTPLGYASTSYQTLTGDNGTSFAGNKITFKRTFIIPNKPTPYTVNEIGWNSSSLGTTTNGVGGRIVLTSSDVVGTSNFYVVSIEMEFTVNPGTPTAVSNVGTNIDTSGNAMVEWFSMTQVGTSGVSFTPGGGFILDAQTSGLFFATSNYTQNSTIATVESSGPTISSYLQITVSSQGYGKQAAVGTMAATLNFSVTTNGETLYGIICGRVNGPLRAGFDIKFNTPYVAPVGTFQPVTTVTVVFSRTLTN